MIKNKRSVHKKPDNKKVAKPSGAKSRFLLAALGSQGDIVPLLWVGRQLQARGHEVSLMANAYFENLITRAGIRFVPVGTALEYVKYFKNSRVWDRGKGFECTSQLMEDTAEKYRDAILKQAGDFDLLINNPLSMYAGIVAEKYGKPAITVHPDPYSFWFSACDMPVLNEKLAFLKKTPKKTLDAGMKVAKAMMFPQLIMVNRFRKKLGLKPIKDFYDNAWVGANAHAGLFPDWFAKKQPDWPQPFETFEFPIVEGLAPMDRKLKNFLKAGEPPIVWTFGSANWHAHELSDIAVTVSRFLRRRAVIVTGAEAEGSPEKGMLRVKSAPFDRLLKSSCAIVHHGGIGTIAYALKAGIPQLLIPMAFDQFDNADRLKKMGLVSVLNEKERTAEDYARVLGDTLKDKKLLAETKKYSKLIHQGSGKKFADWAQKWVGNKSNSKIN